MGSERCSATTNWVELNPPPKVTPLGIPTEFFALEPVAFWPIAVTTFRVWHERQIRMTIHCAYDQLVRVADLKPHPKNPNTHSAAQVAAIAAVIEGNG